MSGVIDLTGDENLEDDMDEPAHGVGKRQVVEVGTESAVPRTPMAFMRQIPSGSEPYYCCVL